MLGALSTKEFFGILLIAFSAAWLVGLAAVLVFGKPSDDYWSDL